MRSLLVSPLILLACAASALAHDVRNADGTLMAHDCSAPFFTEGPVRNVSVTLPQIHDCASATWPDIPVGCLAEQPTLTASAE